MKPHILGHLLYALAASAAVLNLRGNTLPLPYESNHRRKIQNANHMFNSIRGAMRQWDNSWNHNGMSFFVATVPQGAQLYHGTDTSEPVKGIEWLAFEPEHALMFARPRMGPPPGHQGPGRRPPPLHLSEGSDMSLEHHPPSVKGLRYHRPSPPPYQDLDKSPGSTDFETQHILSEIHPESPPPEMQGNRSGYLHFYRASHDLKLVYIDGLSAGKTLKGTLDSQDYILALNKHNCSNMMTCERERAKSLCDLARTDLSGRIDGFVRMEAGFEIILCDFEAGLKFERAQEVESQYRKGRARNPLGVFRLYRAVADRFNGIGGERAVIDYASFVSAFDWKFDKALFVKDKALPGQTLPRLGRQKEKDLLGLQSKVFETIARTIRGELEPTVNWQAIADMFVQRYAAPLKHLSENDMSSKDLKQELRTLLYPFVSDKLNDTTIVTDRCIEQFMPIIWSTTLAGRVVHQVASELCGTLIKTLHGLENAKHHDADCDGKEAISELVSYLDWPVWRECSPACRYDEVCVLPIWPITSSIEDRKVPTCKNLTKFNNDTWNPAGGNSSYWWDGEEMIPHPPRGF